ncbi:MAG: hypothetical protein VX278_16675 [Myxococcota bacterium]|nr:hypothetical protein [Myxococcota bacterium]
MKRTKSKGRYHFSTTRGILSFIAVVAMFPSVVMMISFVIEGSIPPPAPFFIFVVACLLLGFKRALVLDEATSQLYHETYIWKMTVRSSIIPASEIQHLYLQSSTHEETEWERNDYTNEYEVVGTGRVTIAWRLYLVIKNHIYSLPWEENTRAELNKLGKLLAKKLNVTYYPPTQKPPNIQSGRRFSFVRVFWSAVFLIIVYACIENHRHHKEIEILSEERAAAIGLAKAPDMLTKPLEEGKEVMVFCPVYYTWYLGEVKQSSENGTVSVTYFNKYDLSKTRKFRRKMIRERSKQ